jgi:hypothetical protein
MSSTPEYHIAVTSGNQAIPPPKETARPTEFKLVREDLEELLKRRFFISRAFDLYGGVAGLYDLGVYALLD